MNRYLLILLFSVIVVGSNGNRRLFTTFFTSTFGSTIPLAKESSTDSRTDDGLKIGVMTWNLAERSPTYEECGFLNEFSTQSCDIIALGIQECEDIKPRRHEGRRSKKWRELTTKTLNPRNYERFAHHKLGGMQLSLFINQKAKEKIDGIQTIEVPCGIGNVLSNKGAIVMLVRLGGKTIAFINSHLAAHHNQIEARNADYHRIVDSVVEKAHRKWIYSLKTGNQILVEDTVKDKSTPQEIESKKRGKRSRIIRTNRILKSTRGRKKQSITALSKDKAVKPKLLSNLFDLIFFFGDLNYRVELPRLELESFCETYATTEDHQIIIPRDRRKKKTRSIPTFSSSNDTKTLTIRRKVLLPSGSHKNPHQNIYSLRYQNFQEDLQDILLSDQLLAQINRKTAFENFLEGPILFPPSFKYDKQSDQFDTSVKARCPAWTDRILYSLRNQESVNNGSNPSLAVDVNDYYSIDVRSSDHRPVCGIYRTNF